MKTLIILLSFSLLLMSLNNIRHTFWSKEELDEFVDRGKQSAEILEHVLSPRIVYITMIAIESLWIIFYFVTINVLIISPMVTIPIVLIIISLYDFFKAFLHVKKNGLEIPKRKIMDIPISIIKCAFIIFFLTIYIGK